MPARNIGVFLAALLATGVPALVYIDSLDYSEDSFGVVLRWGARLAILVFLLIFVARPLRQLSQTPATRWLLSNRRYLGITFAGVMSSHLVFLLWLNGPVVAIPGMIAYTFILLMLVTSFDKPAAALGPKHWRLLHKSGIYFLTIIFSATIISGLRENGGGAIHATLAVLLVGALFVRAAAYARRKSGNSRATA